MRWLAGLQLPRGLLGKISRQEGVGGGQNLRVDTGIHVEICRGCVDVRGLGRERERERERENGTATGWQAHHH